jgi:hypothetical protein
LLLGRLFFGGGHADASFRLALYFRWYSLRHLRRSAGDFFMEAGRGWRLVDSPAALAARYHRMYSADDFRAPWGGRGGIALAGLIFMPAP